MDDVSSVQMTNLWAEVWKLYVSLDNQVRDGNYDPALVEQRNTLRKAADVIQELGSVKS